MKTIITNGISFSPPSYEVKPIHILMEEVTITKISEVRIPSDPEDQVFDVGGRLVLPGFVDSHTHLAQSFGRGIYDNQHLTHWLNSLNYFFDLSSEEAYLAVLIGCLEALRSGTTTVAEMTSIGEQGEITLQAISDSGLRAVVCTTVGDYQEGDNPPPALNADQSLMEIRRLFKKWHGAADGRISMRVSPVGLPACTEELMRGARALADELGAGLHTHCCEGETETANSYERFGLSEVEVLERCGVLGPDAQLVHCIWLSDHDKQLIAGSGSHVITCPSTNTKVTDGMPPMPDLHRLGVNLAIGCDGEASSGSYDMLAAVKI